MRDINGVSMPALRRAIAGIRLFLRGLLAGADRRGLAILLLLWILAYAAFARPEPGYGLVSRADGTWMYLQMRSHVLDRDVDYTNDYLYAGSHPDGTPYWIRWFPDTALGKPSNPWTMGTGWLLTPFFALSVGVCKLANVFGAAIPSHGVTLPHQYVTYVGTVIYAFWGFVLVFQMNRRRFGSLASWVGGVAVLLTSPLFFYTTYSPSYSHAFSFFISACLLWAWDTLLSDRRDGPELPAWWRWALLGALTGMAALVRPQLVIFALPAALRWLDLAWRHRSGARALGRLALYSLISGGTAFLVFLPQMLLWKSLYGKMLVVPQGDDFMVWNSSLMWETLFSDRSGLFTITPAMGLAALGLVLALRRHRSLALLFGGLLVLTAFVNGAAWDYWGGWTFGARRFCEVVTVLMTGGAVLVAELRSFAAGRPRLAGWLAAGILFAPFVVFNQWLMRKLVQDYHFTTEIADRDMTFYGKRFIDDVYATVGNPFSYPHSLVLRVRDGVPLGSYTRIVTDYPLDHRSMGSVRIDLTSERWRKLIAGGAVLESRGGRAMWVVNEDCVEMFLPLRLRHAYELSVIAAAGGFENPPDLKLDGVAVSLLPGAAGAPGTRYVLPVSLVRAGLNKLSLCGLPAGTGILALDLAYAR